MFEHQVTLRWSDYDPLHHVNNVKYLEFMQDARIGVIESMDIPRSTLSTVGHLVARTEIDYLKPIGMDVQSITVRITLDRIGGASYTLGYEFADSAGNLYAKASTVMVTVDMRSESVIRVPDDIREVFERHLEAAES